MNQETTWIPNINMCSLSYQICCVPSTRQSQKTRQVAQRTLKTEFWLSTIALLTERLDQYLLSIIAIVVVWLSLSNNCIYLTVDLEGRKEWSKKTDSPWVVHCVFLANLCHYHVCCRETHEMGISFKSYFK